MVFNRATGKSEKYYKSTLICYWKLMYAYVCRKIERIVNIYTIVSTFGIGSPVHREENIKVSPFWQIKSVTRMLK